MEGGKTKAAVLLSDCTLHAGYLGNVTNFSYQFTQPSTAAFNGSSVVTSSVDGKSSQLAFTPANISIATGGYSFLGALLSTKLRNQELAVCMPCTPAQHALRLAATAHTAASLASQPANISIATGGYSFLGALQLPSSLTAQAAAAVGVAAAAALHTSGEV